MRITTLALSAAALALAPSAALAASAAYNTAPSSGWFFGTGNNYSPANTAVFTSDDGNELFLRWHQRDIALAPVSNGSVYTFALGTTPLNFDWGIYSATDSLDGVKATITVTDVLHGTTFQYDAFANGNDNEFDNNGAVENSAQLGFDFLLGSSFNPNLNNTYNVTLNVTGLSDGDQSFTTTAVIGDGAPTAAVPEPASWALMLGGFGLIGTAMRRRKTRVTFA